VRPRDEPVATDTDTIYSDTLGIDCGVTSAQLFVGTKTHTADVYPIKSNKQFVNTLLDNITQCGAPTKLISDRAQVEISERVKQVLQPLHISTWQSEPHQQHQNPAERQYQNIKQLSGAPAYTWFLCLMYVCFLLNNEILPPMPVIDPLELIGRTFLMDKEDTAPPQTGYKKIHTHLVYDCKHDGRHKAWMVADGHLTDIPLESMYSGVVSLRGLRIVTFLF
jgi:hypothetical protein